MRALAVAILASLAAAPVFTQTFQSGTPAGQETGTIRGRVTAGDTGKPLRRVQVSIRPASEASRTPPIAASTNAAGVFEVKDVPAGSYYVSAARAGFVTLQYGQRRPRERGVPVEVRADRLADRIDIVLPRGAVLAGLITDERGHPYPGVRVDALAMRYDQGRRVPQPVGGSTTDDRGQFRISGLAPGSYYVMASSNETWRTEKKETLGYASTYYPGVTADQARLLMLAPSEQRLGLDFGLAISRTARVSGRVLRPAGAPLAGGRVSLMYAFPGAIVMTAGARSATTAGDGSFEFRDVPAAMYRLSTSGAGMDITVTGTDIEDLVLAQKEGSTVLGTVVAEDGAPPPFLPSGVYVTLVNASEDVLPTVYVNAVNSDWSFRLRNLGGPFLFRVRGIPEGWMLAAVRLGEKDITDVPWDVPKAGEQIGGLTVVLSPRTSTVSGTVARADGAPTSDAAVLIFPDDPALWGPGSRFVRITRPGSDGRFTMSGLPAGSYRAIARAFIEEGQWEDRAFLEEVRDDAVRFMLLEGGSESVALQVRPADRDFSRFPGLTIRNPLVP